MYIINQKFKKFSYIFFKIILIFLYRHGSIYIICAKFCRLYRILVHGRPSFFIFYFLAVCVFSSILERDKMVVQLTTALTCPIPNREKDTVGSEDSSNRRDSARGVPEMRISFLLRE